MDSLVVVAVTATLCLVIRLLACPPSWLGRVADRVTRPTADDDGEWPAAAADGPGLATSEWELMTHPFIQHRLDALVAELERLDRDPDVFAKAFHTMAARSARDALLADAARLATQPSRCAGQTFAVELVGPWTGAREEIEL